MLTPEFKTTPTTQNFADFEKEALGEVVLKTVGSDLQQYLCKFHVQQMKDLEEKMTFFEKRCTHEIQKSLEKHVKLQLEAHFKQVIEACQNEITQMASPLFKRAEKDVQSFTHTVSKATEVCSTIRAQYTLRWSKPFFTLIFSTALAGAFMGLILLFLQVPFLSVLLMNAHTREAYETGLRVVKLRKELEARSLPAPQEAKVQKALELPNKKKKKSSK